MDDPKSLIPPIGTINVIGNRATGVAVHTYQPNSGDHPKSGKNEADEGMRDKDTPSFDYAQYADPMNMNIYCYSEDGEAGNAKIPNYEEYKVSGKGIKRKGLALIINVHANGQDEREGSENDVQKMEGLWRKLGFEVEVKNLPTNTSKTQINTALQNYAGFYGGIGVIVIIVMSHGTVKNGEEVFATSDGKFIRFDDVISLFDNRNAKSLRGIPKLFFFQYCRGHLRDFLEEDGDFGIDELSVGESEEDAEEEDGEEDLPLRSDMMISHASMQGFKALRNPAHGSHFFNVIANVFMRHAKHEHVLELMTRVNSAMASKRYEWEGKRRKQMNEVKFDLTKRLYLLK